ncbi:PAS domain S-box protein [Pseudonocardia bannensis]|uniref:PAS domain S-box protein n=1 Tax=Pseudonocardia bannensis TaxID=630973 RepID=A0A848DS26_9PSEU|nr:PAS domain S-box protein [Pseudonocardia bannensis]NMH95538.1 PAS domain S-box protein [Pseudonocardia bannensis]
MIARSARLGSVPDLNQLVLDAAPEGVLVLDDSGRIVVATEPAAALIGTEASALIDRTIDGLLTEDPRIGRGTRCDPRSLLRAAGSWRGLRARRADGGEVAVEATVSSLHLAGETMLVAVVREAASEMGDAQLRRVLHALDADADAIFVLDPGTLTYRYVNEGALRLVGYGRERLLRMTPLHLDRTATTEQYHRIVEALEDAPTRPVVRRATLEHRDGTKTAVEETYRWSVPERDGSRWIVVSVRELAARGRVEEAILAEERERIALELNDRVVQRLFAAGLDLQPAVAAVDEEHRTRLAGVVEQLDQAIKDVRSTVFALREPRGAGGVVERVADLVALAGETVGFPLDLRIDGDIEAVPAQVTASLLAVLRAALIDVVRSAAVRAVGVTVTAGRDIELVVSDQDVGIAAPVDERSRADMVDRADRLGGALVVEKTADGGAELRWRVPVRSGRPPRRAAESPAPRH